MLATVISSFDRFAAGPHQNPFSSIAGPSVLSLAMARALTNIETLHARKPRIDCPWRYGRPIPTLIETLHRGPLTGGAAGVCQSPALCLRVKE